MKPCELKVGDEVEWRVGQGTVQMIHGLYANIRMGDRVRTVLIDKLRLKETTDEASS